MLHIALTGGIGCGKTTVLHEFAHLGVPCFDADKVAATYYNDPDFVAQVDKVLGGGTMMADGSADKRAIAARVFADRQALLHLNALVHPRVWDDYLAFSKAHAHNAYCLFESAIIYEYSFDRLVDRVVCVYLEQEERLRRLAIRDGATREQLLARMHNQLPAEVVMDRADYVILNYEGNPRRRQVETIHQQLLNEARRPVLR